jgi:hypothetical protein
MPYLVQTTFYYKFQPLPETILGAYISFDLALAKVGQWCQKYHYDHPKWDIFDRDIEKAVSRETRGRGHDVVFKVFYLPVHTDLSGGP